MADFPKQLLASPSGFPDLGPAEAIALEKMLATIRKHFELAGYSPVETPLVERPEVLTAKVEGEITSQIYGLRLLNPAAGADGDEKDLALRYDHTVPLARYLAAHYSELSFPFRRYAIGPVFRGERAKEGRYRQFIQADIDAVGENTLSPLHDAEMVGIIAAIFMDLDIGDITIRINNRKALASIIKHMGGSEEKVPALMRAVDHLEKVGKDATSEALVALGMSKESASQMLDFISTKRSPKETIAFLESTNSDGAAELKEVLAGVEALGVAPERYTIDLCIARGLDYYTGTVYETTLDAHPELGSIASGGRYDDLASAFISRKLPGVGISIGVTRLLLRLIKAGVIKTDTSTPAKVLIATEEGNQPRSFELVVTLRSAGIRCEIYLESESLGAQLKYAEKKGFPLAISNKDSVLTLHNLKSGDKAEVSIDNLVSSVQKLIP